MVSFSGGKDSTAMLLRLLELKCEIQEIVFADTGFEFPELYKYIEKIEQHINKKITIITPPLCSFQELREKNNAIVKEAREVYGLDVPEPLYQSKWTDSSEIPKWHYWFYGCINKVLNKDGTLKNPNNFGKQRGFPLVAFPCWWTRESKIVPLHNIQKDADEVYIGIAYDERERMSKVNGRLKYPLVEWKWTEQDCIDYLNKKGLFNPLYVNFNRLGCWFCQKQGEASLYVLYKNYPELWEQMKWWDKESKRISGHYIKGNYPLTYIEEDFKRGKIPNKLPKYQCWNGCESVKKAFKQKQCNLGEFAELENKPEVSQCDLLQNNKKEVRHSSHE